MERVDWHDVQGLLTSGYGGLPFSAYVVWRFQPGGSGSAARAWLGDLAERLMRADGAEAGVESAAAPQTAPTSIGALRAASGNDRKAVNLALTADGLRELQLDAARLADFSFEFLEGMAPKPTSATEIPRRCNVLGDAGASSPAHWEWGGWGTCSAVHGLLLLYAADETALQELVRTERELMKGAAEVVACSGADEAGEAILYGRIYDDRKEHFGFADGISQPVIEGTPTPKREAAHGSEANDSKKLDLKDRRITVIKPGEFIFGYPNERRERICSEAAKQNRGVKDLLRNGTYLVFRQLEQDVDGFTGFVANLAERIHGNVDPESVDEVAARLIGRYRNGEPLVRRGATSMTSVDRNDFLYSREDGSGMACPIGAHIRRANPRDAIGSDPDTALRLSRMHRIMRRGRTYGPRRDLAATNGNDRPARRGTAFIALNADIAGQFEMIQHSWLNNPQFGGLPVGSDPIGHVAHPGDEIVIQHRPFNLHVERPRPFVTVRGGAYFFMPGIEAVRALADLGDGRTRPTSPSQHRAEELAVSGD